MRLIALNQSLWLDEATTARVVQQYNFFEIVTKFSPHDFHPPLYYLFMKLWTNFFGYSEIALRMPSVVFSLLTGWIVYWISRLRLKMNYGEARWAAIFFLFNPLIIYYSQEARMYMMATFFLTAALYFYLSIFFNLRGSPAFAESDSASLLNRRGSDNIFLFSLFICLSFLTFYGSIFLIIPMLLYLLYKKWYRGFFASCFMFAVTCLILSPLLSQQLSNAREQLQLVVNWQHALGQLNLKNLLLIPLKFSVGRISFSPKWLYWSISGLWTMFVWFFVIKGGLKYKYLFILIVSTLGFGILFSFFTPLLQYFRFLYLIPLVSLLLASGFKIPSIRIIGIIGFMVFSLAYLFNPHFHREDWKSLVRSLPRDKQIFMVKSSSDPVLYYRKDISLDDLRKISKEDLKLEVIVIPYTADIHGINYREALGKRRFILVGQNSFYGLMLEQWKR